MANTNITYRAVKGSALTFSEMDQNFASFFYSASAYQDGNGFNRLRLHYTGSSLITGDFDNDRYLDVLLPDAQGGVSGAETGGSDKQIQFNDEGNLAGDPEFLFDKTTNRVSIGQNTFDSSLTVRGTTTEAGSVIKINSFNTKDVRSQSYLDISKTNNSRLKIGLVANGQTAIPTIQASTANLGFAGGLEVALGENKHIKVDTNGTTIGVGTTLTAPNKTLTVIGQMGIGNGATTSTQSTFLTLADGSFSGALTNYLPTNAGTAGLLITTPYSNTTGGNIVVGINKASGANETFSVLSGANNSFNKAVATFKADGNIGFNQPNPKEILHVEGNITGSGNINVKGTGTIQTIAELATLNIDFENSTEEYAKTLVKSSTGLIKYMDAAPIPKGGIIMWSGAVNNIPIGWRLCNGVSVNGVDVPDLRERFIVGAGGENTTSPTNGGPYSVGDIGGTTYTPSGTITINKLTTTMIPRHTHMFLGDDELYVGNVTDYYGICGAYNTPTTAQLDQYGGGPSTKYNSAGLIGGYDAISETGTRTGKLRQAFHTGINTTAVRQTTIMSESSLQNPTGTFCGNAATVVPPYYALAFIIYVGAA